MRFESFENDGSRWLCKNTPGHRLIMFERVGKKKKNLFSTLWYKGAILLAEM
jgi:hypothetical protein